MKSAAILEKRKILTVLDDVVNKLYVCTLVKSAAILEKGKTVTVFGLGF